MSRHGRVAKVGGAVVVIAAAVAAQPPAAYAMKAPFGPPSAIQHGVRPVAGSDQRLCGLESELDEGDDARIGSYEIGKIDGYC